MQIPRNSICKFIGILLQIFWKNYCKKTLTSCYENSLNLAKEKGLKTIAFPLISAGVYGYPQSDAIKVAIETMKLHQNDFDEITLVLFGEREFEIAKEDYPEFL